MKELKPRIHENGMDYVLVGDYYVPDLKLPEERRPIGHWGRLHQSYLKLHRPMKPSSGFARISWGGAISPRNRRSTLSGNSMKPKNALMAVIEKALRQNQVVILTT